MLLRVVFIVAFSALTLACTAVNQGIQIADGQVVDGDLSTVNGAIQIGADCEVNGRIANVNGSISVGPNSRVGPIRNVNGAITVSDGAQAGQTETVNGALRLAENVTIDGTASTVNGAITVGSGTVIMGDVSTVNGRLAMQPESRAGGRASTVNGGILLDQAVAASLQTTNGSIELRNGTVIEGELRVREPGRTGRDVPTIVIGENVRVAGPLQFDRQVELFIHESAEVGQIQGAEPRYFSGDRP